VVQGALHYHHGTLPPLGADYDLLLFISMNQQFTGATNETEHKVENMNPALEKLTI
jgi:hypothetical protein